MNLIRRLALSILVLSLPSAAFADDCPCPEKKGDDVDDALYHFEIGVVTSISRSFELKLAFMDDYKNKPPSPEIKKNDTSFIGSIIYKF